MAKETIEACGVEFPNDPEGALAVLRDKKYPDDAALGFARAARSWTKKDSPAWNLWKGVEGLLKAPQEGE